jgi:hypothetical protein
VFSRRQYKTALPPGIIYRSANIKLQSSWLEDIVVGQDNLFVSSSPSGWTNTELGLAWLEQTFDRSTMDKANRAREWCLLILESHGSHGSHATTALSDDRLEHRIIVHIYPTHSTHTL